MADFGDHHTPEGQMLRVTPNEFITFSRSESTNETNVELTCISKFPIIYKIQTTSPDKFRVRPRYGLLSPNESVSVSILLKSEHHLSEPPRDKFLVMTIAAPGGSTDISTQLMTEIWRQKQSGSLDIEQHRLCCIYKDSSESKRNGFGHSSYGDMSEGKFSGSHINDLEKHAKQLEKQLKCTQILQCLTLVFLLILSAAVVYLLKLQSAGGTELNYDGIDEATDAGAAHVAAAVGSCPTGRNL